MSKTVARERNPTSEGKQALSPTSMRIISSRVGPIFPIPGGKHPGRWLWARTVTEAGEFPRLVQEFQGGEGQHGGGEAPVEEVVTKIEFEDERPVFDGRGYGAREAVGVEVEEGEVRKEAEFGGEGPGYVGVVEVNAGHGLDVGILGGRGTEDAGVGADIRAEPVASEVEGVGCHGLLPCLEGYVGVSEARARESQSVNSRPKVTIDGHEDVPENDEDALLKAVSNQPVSVAIDVRGQDFQFYSEGVFTGECGTELNHCVAAVGYGTTLDGTKYRTVKNCWAEEWGEKGYIRMQRGVSAEEGLCGIAMEASYPIKNSSTNPSADDEYSMKDEL
ncbi:hypothetical protein Cgig2_015710 [Carnegiea gigantea]|uniref:Peptidase C1A papain C-terminal domain-containing protein n=1 Tax=Carnegiea gigantea TaxID=171969 RepID=A0A9Q1Q5R9_9CARY|nr:hypothetical protein Cgig2_015710 [Carnegiea gigantea]